MLDEIDEAQKRYKEQFGRFFPLACLCDTSTENIVDEINKCIRANKQFKPDAPDGAII